MQKSIINYTTILTVVVSALIGTNASENTGTHKLPNQAQAADSVPTLVHTIDASHGKPGASVRLTYQIPEAIEVGDTFNVNLAFSSQRQDGQLRIEMNADAGITLMTYPLVVVDLPSTSSDVNVQLNANVNGLFFLNVSAKEFDVEGNGHMSRSFSVPLQVGPVVNGKENSVLITGDKKEKIIEMPAERLL